MNLLELLEDRKRAYKKTWEKLSRRDKFIIIFLISVGIAQIFVGILLCRLGN